MVSVFWGPDHYAPAPRYLSALCRTTYARLNKTFPGINAEHFKSLMRYIQARIEEQGERIAGELPLTSPASVLEFAHGILPRDDSSLQWSPVGSGLTDNPARTLEKLFDRMVMCHEERPAVATRSDDDVWRNFRRNLEERHVLQHLQPKRLRCRTMRLNFSTHGRTASGIASSRCLSISHRLNPSATRRTDGLGRSRA